MDRMEHPLMWPKGQPLTAREVASLRHLGFIIRSARLRLGYSQRQLERLSGVDQTTISRLETVGSEASAWCALRPCSKPFAARST
jgi:Helix-turn-helix